MTANSETNNKVTLKLQLSRMKRQFLKFVWSKTISQNENYFVTYLRENYHDLIVRKFNVPQLFQWNEALFPTQVEEFGDLAFLFWLAPLNRGLLRQDFDEAYALFKTLKNLSNPVGIEIGRYFGASTLLLALAVGEAGKVISIDMAPQNDQILNSLLQRYHLNSRVDLIVADANDVDIQHELDFVFIDGDHSFEGAKRDHNKWTRLVKPEGYIVHHDMSNTRPYSTQWSSLANLRQQILVKQKSQLELVYEAGSLCIFKKISDVILEL